MAVVPVPMLLTAPGLRVSVQFPEGKPLRGTLPVAVVQVGWVMLPTVGAADGVVTVIVPAAVMVPQPPVSVTV